MNIVLKKFQQPILNYETTNFVIFSSIQKHLIGFSRLLNYVKINQRFSTYLLLIAFVELYA